ncbi:LutB/LldF family L-lactate oxidation iron-sulfur protein [Streptomyces griseomycini]|uniref:LutB/LldF family L-lactate oxidation iron-sulfur protein n=1 Tax=Streptomyces griseomycini TaxID=66895 RepID=UPI003422D408
MSGADNVVWLGTPAFPKAARTALADTRMRANLRRATSTIRDKRLAVAAELADWEELRERAATIKRNTLRHLDHHLLRLEKEVTAAGGTVHWAADAAEANRIVTQLVKATGESAVVKVKSMATQEIGLNEALADAGIRAYETDLAELIVQLGGDRPSHILVPAIHRGRSEIREIFRRQMGQWGRPAPDDLTDDPRDLAEAARLHLREKFLRAKAAVSGANFAAADTGTVVVVESEGNGRMCLTLPETLITVMGIEKVLPSFADLDVFLQLLPRSSTGERMNPYTSLWTGVTEDDGPRHFHLVLLDNGRTATLADEVGRQALNCIRCSACLNVCPVYERTGGHAYGSVYPGPIGAVLTPQLVGVENAASLPFASTLCGACYDACPVKIDIPEVLAHLRAEAVEAGRRDRLLPTPEALAMKAAAAVLSSPKRLAAVQRLAALATRLVARDGRIGFLPGPLARWSATRDAPAPARESMRAWWRRTKTTTRDAGRTTAGEKEAR